VLPDEVELRGAARARPSVDKVMMILAGMLAGGPRPLPEIRMAVEGIGFGERTLYAAKDTLGIVGQMSRAGGHPTCLWALPPRATEPLVEDEPAKPAAPARTGRILKVGDPCPRCRGRLFSERGDLYCLNCGYRESDGIDAALAMITTERALIRPVPLPLVARGEEVSDD
jgi:hypothetical protein